MAAYPAIATRTEPPRPLSQRKLTVQQPEGAASGTLAPVMERGAKLFERIERVDGFA
jgi:hypothetical protein